MMGSVGCFDLATVVQLTDEKRASILVQLSRWCRSGKLIPLRRGMYALPKCYRSVPINPARLANEIYSPSYLSTYWALGYYGLIPEKVVSYTSATTRKTKVFRNDFGVFRYQNIKQEIFFGFKKESIGQEQIRIAEAEKALLDLFYLQPGEWGLNRMKEMRFQNIELIHEKTLVAYARQFESDRLIKSLDVWRSVVHADLEGTVEL